MAGNDPGFFDTPGLPADYYFGSATDNPFERQYAKLIANGIPPNVAYSMIVQRSYPEGERPHDLGSGWPHNYAGKSSEEAQGNRVNPPNTLWPGRQPYVAGPVPNMPGSMNISDTRSAPISYAQGGLNQEASFGSGLVPPALQPGQLGMSPDISDATAANRPQDPNALGGLRRSLQNPLALPTNALAPGARLTVPPEVPSATRPPDVPPAAAGQQPEAPGARGSTVVIPGGGTYQLTQDELAKYYSLLNPGDQNAKAYTFLRGLPKEAQVNATPPGTPPASLQPGGATTVTPPNALSPAVPGAPMGAPATQAPTYNKYDIIRRFEANPGVGLTPTPDTDGRPVIGYGHVIQEGEPYGPGTRITEADKEALLTKDLSERYVPDIRRQFPGFDKLNVNQQEALTSYYYNTGFLPKAVNNFDPNNPASIQAIGAAIRAGPYTAKQPGGAPSVYMHMLEVRRNAEADLFGLPEGQNIDMSKYTGAYTSGAPVHGSVAPSGKPYAVGGAGAGVATPPSQYGFGGGGFVPDNPFAPRPPGVPNTPAQDLAELNQRDRAMRALQMWGMLSGIAKGVKFTPVPVSYDPFKVKEAGQPERVGSIPVVAPPELERTPPMTRTKVEAYRVPIVPGPVGVPRPDVRRTLTSGV